MNTAVLLHDLIEQLRSALAALLDAPVHTTEANVSGQMWRVRVSAAGLPPLVLSFDLLGAQELVRITSGQDQPTDDTIQDNLIDLCGKVVGTLATKETGVADIVAEPDVPQLVDASTLSEVTAAGFTSATLPVTLVLAVSAEIDANAQTEMPLGDTATTPPAVSAAERLDVLLDIDLPLLVRFGCTQLPLKTLTRLGPGSLIDLARTPDDPVEMLVGDRVVARGEVVVVSGSYGIRILEVVGREPVRGMEAQ